MSDTDVVVVSAVRTPIGKRGGALAALHPVDLSAIVLNEVVNRAGVSPEEVDDVIWGCVTQIGDQSSNVGRFGVLAAGWPESVPAVTVNRACGSSQQAIESASHALASGAFDIVVAGGVESMSRAPLGAAREVGEPYGQSVLDRYEVEDFNQGLGAEIIAKEWGLSRQELDEYASRSHELADAAIRGGQFSEQVIAIQGFGSPLTSDEGVRPGTTPEILAGLKPVFKDDGVIHAGNASQMSDGAAALVLMRRGTARARGLAPLARVLAGSVAASDPVRMLTAPIPATEKVLARAGLSIDDIGAYEVNEAFAPVPLAWRKSIGASLERLNPVGGAIAVGHPLGASGAILATRLIHHMLDRGIQYGLQTMCEGGGTANATLFELA